MSLTETVRETLAAHQADGNLGDPIADAERLADQFADVKPAPYVVPIERFVGMAVEMNLHRPTAQAI